MPLSLDSQLNIRRYLLGKLDGEDREELEKRLLTEDAFFDELMATEDELIDEFLLGDLSSSDQEMFQRNFLTTVERQAKLRFSRALKRYAASRPISQQSPLQIPKKTFNWRQLIANPYVRSAMFAALLVLIGLGAWRVFFYQSKVDKGLVALNAAYRQQRPLEARITKLSYAPFVRTRGVPERVNSLERQRAEGLLREAEHEKRSPASLHALGKMFLANKDFDNAIEQFEAALKEDPNNANIHADLGAARLEKGKSGVDGTVPAETGKGMEQLTRSLDSLNRALTLDSSLLEALFNKALAEQYSLLYTQAEQDWREYLKRDATSPWAAEAQQNLKRLEERKTKAAMTKDQLREDFLRAYKNHDNHLAWQALSLSRSRTGNAIIEDLIDASVKQPDPASEEAKERLQMVSYAGRVEQENTGDKYTSEVGHLYSSVNLPHRAIMVEARALIKTGTEFYTKSEFNSAIAQFSKAGALFEEAHDEPEALIAEAWVGYSQLRIPDPENASRAFEHLSKVFAAKGYRSLYAQTLVAQADAMNARNEFSKVLELADQSLELSQQIQDQANVVRCIQEQTTIQNILGNYREALATTFRALTLSETLPPDSKRTWPSYHETSMTMLSLGLPMEALQFENEALGLALSAGLPLQASRSYDRLALIFERLKNYDEAMRDSEAARVEGLKVPDEQTKTNILAHAALNLARLYRESGDPRRALSSADEAIRLYQDLRLDIYQYPAHKTKFLALMALDDNATAEIELQQTLYWFEQNREKIAEETYRNKFFDTDQNTYDLAVDFEYSRQKDSTKAFDYAEGYRGRSLLDLITNGRHVQDQINGPEIKLPSPAPPLTFAEIQKDLPAQAQLLEYSVLDDKVVMWLVTSDGLRKSADTKVTRAALDEKIRTYLRTISPGSPAEDGVAEGQAKELYAWLISPIKEKLDRRRLLCIVPDSILAFLPFSALLDPASGKYLVEDYAVQTAPSSTIFIGASERATHKTPTTFEKLLIVGNPRFDRSQFSDLPDLPGAAREGKAIADLYSAQNGSVVTLFDNDATANRVKESMPEADVVHLATHAIANDETHLLSELVFSRDAAGDRLAHHAANGVIRASEIYAMDFSHTRLVVLSACQTGIERAYRGEGAVGLARPFIASGVPLVVASLWAVESEATADLMISFHKHRVQDGVSTVEALQRAQLEILHNHRPNLRKDFGWAAFTAIGGYAAY